MARRRVPLACITMRVVVGVDASGVNLGHTKRNQAANTVCHAEKGWCPMRLAPTPPKHAITAHEGHMLPGHPCVLNARSTLCLLLEPMGCLNAHHHPGTIPNQVVWGWSVLPIFTVCKGQLSPPRARKAPFLQRLRHSVSPESALSCS